MIKEIRDVIDRRIENVTEFSDKCDTFALPMAMKASNDILTYALSGDITKAEAVKEMGKLQNIANGMWKKCRCTEETELGTSQKERLFDAIGAGLSGDIQEIM